jgi:hypothetical protein
VREDAGNARVGVLLPVHLTASLLKLGKHGPFRGL